MKIKWLGHASFIIETLGKRIITDPFDEQVGYPVYADEVDYATISHDHWDHNATHVLKENPHIVDTVDELDFDGLIIKGIDSYHDPEQGKLRGSNIIFKIIAEGINLVHLGDLGQLLDEEQIQAIGQVDILLIPVGGTYTIDAKQALKIVEDLKPKLIIPMHYKTPHLSFELAPVEDFISNFEIVTKKPYLEIDKTALENKNNEIILLDYL
ncbi:MAG: MBL fold metallo-hydrolase [Syntrophomonadaceae bacterium]|nr:MBL fold metallo-hydrolase [Syntrophomonadaceae bacterium]